MLEMIISSTLIFAQPGPVELPAFSFVTLAKVSAKSKKRTPPKSTTKPSVAKPVTAKPAATPTVVSKSTAMPADVNAFIVRRGKCDHLRGEEAYDPDRAEFLDKAITENCEGTDKELRGLRKRYAKNPAVKARLAQYENDVEEGPAGD